MNYQHINHINLHGLFKLQQYIRLNLKIHENAFSYIHVGCDPETNNTVKSPGYPNSYPPNTDCFSWLPIPQGMEMVMSFNDFELENSESCT